MAWPPRASSGGGDGGSPAPGPEVGGPGGDDASRGPGGAAADAAADAADGASGTPCRSCLTGTGSYMDRALTWACHYDAPESSIDTADNTYPADYNSWILRCVSTDASIIVSIWFNAGSMPGVEDTPDHDGLGIFMYTSGINDSTRYLQPGNPHQTKNHIAWSAVASGTVTGTFEAAWGNGMDGLPYGSVSGTFHVTK